MLMPPARVPMAALLLFRYFSGSKVPARSGAAHEAHVEPW